MKRKPPPNPTERPPRVLFIATDLSTGGGVNRAIRDQSVLLKSLGAEVSVVNARSDRPSSYPFPPGIPVEGHQHQSVAAYFRLLLRLRRRKPDLVVSSWTQDNVLVTLAFLLSGARVALVEHTSWKFHGSLIRRLRQLIYPLAWRVIVLNPLEFRHYHAFLANVRLLPNIIPDAAPLSPAPREKLIVAVGHLEDRKNFADAIRAMAQSGLENQGWSLAIIGEGPEKPRLEQLIAELGLTRTIIHSPTSDISRWYARSSITLVTAKLEVFSLVLAEAMQAGVVPLAYATDGPSFILEDFPDNTVPVGDVSALATKLQRLANDENLDRMRPQMRRAIETRFSTDVIAGQWQQLLAEALPCDPGEPC